MGLNMGEHMPSTEHIQKGDMPQRNLTFLVFVSSIPTLRNVMPFDVAQGRRDYLVKRLKSSRFIMPAVPGGEQRVLRARWKGIYDHPRRSCRLK